MSKLLLVCTKYQRKFKDRCSLTQHQRTSTTCRSQTALSIDVNLVNNKELLPPDLLAFSRINLTKHRQALAKNPPATANLVRQQPQSNKTGAAKTTGLKSSLETFIEDDDDSEDNFAPPVFDDEDTEAPEAPAVAVQPGGVSDLSDIDWIRNDWIKYEKRALNFPPFTQQQLEAIRLQAILRNSKACLGTYDKVMHWHFRANGDVHMHEMASSRHFLSRHDLYHFLKERYNRDTDYGIVNELVLPSRKSNS